MIAVAGAEPAPGASGPSEQGDHAGHADREQHRTDHHEQGRHLEEPNGLRVAGREGPTHVDWGHPWTACQTRLGRASRTASPAEPRKARLTSTFRGPLSSSPPTTDATSRAISHLL